jgi:hypothetical protein
MTELYTWTETNGMPTVEDWEIDPGFNTFRTEFGSGAIVRNSKWTNPRYKFKIKYRKPMRKEDVVAIKDFFIERKGAYESFEIYVSTLGTTHTVMFEKDSQQFNIFGNILSNYGTVEFVEEI